MFFYNALLAVKLEKVIQVNASATYWNVRSFYKKCRQQMVKLMPEQNYASAFEKT